MLDRIARPVRSACLTVALLSALAGPMSGPAQAEGPTATLERLIAEGSLPETRFAETFLAQVPAAEVARLIAGLKERFGAFEGVAAAGEGYSLRFAGGNVPTRIVLDDGGRIAGLWFGAVEPAGDIAAQAAAIAALPGRTSLLVLSDGEAVVANNDEIPLAVGSAAKVAVLLAVMRAVAEGKLAWDQVVRLEPGWRSLPTGVLQDWPAGTPVTLATLANLMISVSDNTATDALIRLAGRESVEAVTPRNAPFPTTRELFILKARGQSELRDSWRQGDAGARRALLEEIADAPLPSVQQMSVGVTHDVEWFLTAREICDLLEATQDQSALGINPGPVEAAPWRAVAYKGGSETGVLNLSARLEGEDGRVHCVVATWNTEKALAEEKLLGPFRAIVRRLAEDAAAR